ncbi:MAG: hypothetical protein NTV87_05835, partial [Ignavibacteriae bacterium]|nr:hypothetical protein [Ignavibacteriota bacterium]
TGESYLSVNIEFADETKANFNVFKNKSDNPNAPQFKFWKKDDSAPASGGGNFSNVPPDWAGNASHEPLSPDDVLGTPDSSDDDLPF